MIDAAIVKKIEDIRLKFLEMTGMLRGDGQQPAPESLRMLLDSSDDLKKLQADVSSLAQTSRINRVCDGRVTCTFVGASSQGKTTFLAELFPDLYQRGWLVCDAKDTTSQSLCIEYASAQIQEKPVTVRSYSLAELHLFLGLSRAASEQNGIRVDCDQEKQKVLIDGNKMNVSSSNAAKFKFPPQMELIPFSESFVVDDNQPDLRNFVRSLTTKDAMNASPILRTDKNAYNALQLRALIKSIELTSHYDRLLQLTGNNQDITKICFIDTPGQGTAASVEKDEILFYCLGEKSKNIVIQLWRDDDLDFLIHLMRCKEQSTFQQLWMEIEQQLSPEEKSGLEDRLILLMNSARDFFEDDNIRKRYENPLGFSSGEDQFALVLEDNALKKMSPRGTLQPSAVCFVDTLYRYTTESGYQEAYEEYGPKMEQWCLANGVGYDTLTRLNILDEFKENVKSLCDPTDRGHGFFLKTILRLVEQNGPKMLVQKHLKRTGLAKMLASLSETLNVYYANDGGLTAAATRKALANLGQALAFTDPYSYENYVRIRITPHIQSKVDTLFKNAQLPEHWLSELFKEMCSRIMSQLTTKAESSLETQGAVPIVQREMNYLYKEFRKRWGYATETIHQTGKHDYVKNVVMYTLATHAAEILYKIFPFDTQTQPSLDVHQSEEDKAEMAKLIASINELLLRIQKLYAQYGVS